MCVCASHDEECRRKKTSLHPQYTMPNGKKWVSWFRVSLFQKKNHKQQPLTRSQKERKKVLN